MNTKHKRSCFCNKWYCSACRHHKDHIPYRPDNGRDGILMRATAHLRAVRIPALMARVDCHLPLFDGLRKDTDE